jgi:hypothetical protein
VKEQQKILHAPYAYPNILIYTYPTVLLVQLKFTP